jgi:hypothetical protein
LLNYEPSFTGMTHRREREEARMGDPKPPTYRARKTETGWKVERYVTGCDVCKITGRWQTILYTYPLLKWEECENYAVTIAEMLNAASK